MPQTNLAKKLAVLIDGENVSADFATIIFGEIAKLGDARVKRVYGDFNAGNLKGWTEKLAPHGLVARHQPNAGKGKNSADIALVIDAMDLLLRSGSWLDGFCIVSSDRDFSRLAMCIREEGRDVFGFGATKTPISFRSACKTFQEIGTKSSKPGALAHPQKAGTSRKLPASAAVETLTRAVEVCASKMGWVTLLKLGSHLSNKHSTFDRKRYSGATLSGLMKLTGKFEIDPPKGKSVRVRLLTKPELA